MSDDRNRYLYVLRLADNALVLGQRLSEWIGHAPALEEEMATANVSLDLIGQAKSWLEYAAELGGDERDADTLAFHRDVLDFHNTLLVEQPNGDYALTIARQFLFDAFHMPLLEQLSRSGDERVAEIAAKSAKEAGYHIRRSSEWMIRFGDGTDESHQRVQAAVDRLWPYTGELFTGDALDEAMHQAGVGADLAEVREQWSATVDEVFAEATLRRPEDGWMQSGGKQGEHSEHLGFLLAEMQFLPRAYPDARW
ncbi:1,2-phenylacetyl-CoA epoxidase subunit PaaC [Arhodomonas sp. AD133]|uniref:1,2-phenylacetyl-CoA epoxidase subunit PaaC n=1 Tax=Arhodomonas sp. AD133 TaxID=3415009 RepID=UPI003EBEA579